MIELSDLTLRFAVNECLEKERYRTLIATGGLTEFDEVTKQIDILATDIVDSMCNGGTKSYIFKNGSSIRVIPPLGNNARGHKANLTIVSKHINDNIRRDILSATEIWVNNRDYFSKMYVSSAYKVEEPEATEDMHVSPNELRDILGLNQESES